MKQKPDNVRDTDEDIITITNVRNNESSKPFLTYSDMGLTDKDSRPSSEELTAPLTPPASDFEGPGLFEKGGTRTKVSSDAKRLDDEKATYVTTADNEQTITATVAESEAAITTITTSKEEATTTADNDDNTNSQKEDDGVDSLVDGIKGCSFDHQVLQEEEDIVSKGLSQQMTRLEIGEDDHDGDKEQPEEDDEFECWKKDHEKALPVESAATREEVKDGEAQVQMVKLDAPTQVEEEEDKDADSESETLTQRSPINGIPKNPNQNFFYTNNNGDNVPSSQNIWTEMPNGFPTDYNSLYPQQPSAYQQTGGKGKRRINDLDFDAEAPKFVRPVNEFNNLDAPGQATSHVKSIQVWRRQMSGGTVITNGCNQDFNFNDVGGSIIANGNDFLTANFAQQQPVDVLDTSSDFLHFTSPDCKGDDNIQDIDKLLQEMLDNPPNLSETLPDLSLQNHLQQQQQQQQQQKIQQQCPYAQPLQMPMNSAYMQQQYHQQQQQQQHLHQQNQQQLPQAGVAPFNQFVDSALFQLPPPKEEFHPDQDPRAAIFAPQTPDAPSLTSQLLVYNDLDVGYSSEASPVNEAQFANAASPLSVMEASPAAMFGTSPPQQNLSPPPSNLSNFSQDSGISSPMADDMGLAQITSPRSIQMMTSPESVAHGMGMSDVTSSPPHQGIPAMSPPQYGYQTSSTMSPLSYRSPMMSAVPIPPQAEVHKQHQVPQHSITTANLHQPTGSSSSQGLPFEMEGNYTSTYIDQNLPALEYAVAYAMKDLEVMGHSQNINLTNDVPKPNIPATVPQNFLFCSRPTPQDASHQQLQSLRISDSSPPVGTSRKPPVGSAYAGAAAAAAATMSKISNKKAGAVKKSPIRGPVLVDNNNAGSKVILTNPVTLATALSTTGALVMSSTSTPMPLVNEQGKVAIPASRHRRNPAPEPTSILGMGKTSLLISPNGMPSFLVVAPEKPRFHAIAPKAPAKPLVTPEMPVATATATATATQRQEGQGQGTQCKQVKKALSEIHKLNIARRMLSAQESKDLLVVDDEGDTFLHVAACKCNASFIQALLERFDREGLSQMVNNLNMMGQTALYLAVSDNKPDMVEVFIRYNAEVNHYAEVTLDNGIREKSAAIHRASSKGEEYLNTLKALLRSPNIDLDLMDSEGRTALHLAILNHGRRNTNNQPINSIPVIQALVRAGADLNLRLQKDGKTALMFVLESRNLDLIEEIFHLIEPAKLLSYLKTESFDGITCLKIANSIKHTLSGINQERLSRCLKP